MAYETAAQLRAGGLDERHDKALDQLLEYTGAEEDTLLVTQGGAATTWQARLVQTHVSVSKLAASITTDVVEVDALRVMFDAANGDPSVVDADQAPRIEALMIRLGVGAKSRMDRAAWAILLALFEE